MSPTIVLVHGAFADSSSWDGVIGELLATEHRVVAAPNPLRSVRSDAASVSDLLRTIRGPVVLVGHSYGGQVITNVAPDAADVVGLVYVAAFAAEIGESASALAARSPGSTLGEALVPVRRTTGVTDLYIKPVRFRAQFCADVPSPMAARMAVTQRPITQEALAEPSRAPLWRRVPSWFVLAEQDRNIPIAVQRFTAERAGSRGTLEIAGASHAVAVSHPDAVTAQILEAAALRAVAA